TNVTVRAFSPSSGVNVTEQVVDSPAPRVSAAQATCPLSDSAPRLTVDPPVLVTGIVISICSPTPSGVSPAATTCRVGRLTVNAAVFQPPSVPLAPLDPLEPSESPEPLDPSESPEPLPGSYVTTNWKDPILESSAWSPNATVTVFSPCSGVKTTEQVVDSPASSEAASQVTSPRSDSASSVL